MFELSSTWSEQQTFISFFRKFVTRTNLLALCLLAGISSTSIGVWLLIRNTAPKAPPGEEIKIESSAEATLLVVDVSGAVNNPGVYSLQPGERVAGALQLAGGLASAADAAYINKTLNLAKTISDGEKIYIPFSELDNSTQTAASHTEHSAATVSINTSTQKELEALPNIGATLSQKIIQQRPFNSLSELVTKNVLSEGVFQKIQHLLSI